MITDKRSLCRFGYDSAFIGTTIARSSFKTDFAITSSISDSVSSNITSAFQAGAFFGAIFCFPSTRLLSLCRALLNTTAKRKD